MPKTPSVVGFIGLGNMGKPMARRLLEAGFQVRGYDVSQEAQGRAAASGVHVVTDLAQVASGADILILMLPGSSVVAQVLGDNCLVAALVPGALIVDMSSSEPLATQQLARSLGASGLRMIDAPVSGGVAGAEMGKLTVMVGGELADLETARPFLQQFGRVVHAGPVGAGHAIKALNNLLSATHLWATSEAMLAGQRFGIDPHVMLAIFNASSGRSGSTDNKWPNFIVPGTFDSGFGLRLMVKDMGIAVELARQVGTPGTLAETALKLWQEAAKDLPPSADHTEVARWLASEVPDVDD